MALIVLEYIQKPGGKFLQTINKIAVNIYGCDREVPVVKRVMLNLTGKIGIDIGTVA